MIHYSNYLIILGQKYNAMNANRELGLQLNNRQNAGRDTYVNKKYPISKGWNIERKNSPPKVHYRKLSKIEGKVSMVYY